MSTNLTLIKEKKNLSYIKQFFLFFLIYSVIGWLMETVFCLFELGYFTKRGFLYGPICPIYGYGALILLVLLKPYKNDNLKLFFISIVVFSIFEYLVSFSLEALFATTFWDYTNKFLNLNGRISIFFSVSWGFFALIFINYIHPFIESKLEYIYMRIPYSILSVSINVILILYVIDTFASTIRYMA